MCTVFLFQKLKCKRFRSFKEKEGRLPSLKISNTTVCLCTTGII